MTLGNKEDAIQSLISSVRLWEFASFRLNTEKLDNIYPWRFD